MPVALRLRRPDHRLGRRRGHHGGGPRRGRSRRDRGRGRPVGRAGFGRAVLAGADGPPVPLGWRHGGPRPPLDRLHRGSLRRRRHRGQQRPLPPSPGRDAGSMALASTRSTTSPPTTSRRSATRSRRRSACRPCPARTPRRARSCASAPSGMGWRHDEIPRWMTYPGAGQRRRRQAPEHDRDVPPPGPAGRRPAARRASPRSAA